jgi:hypothetical protein
LPQIGWLPLGAIFGFVYLLAVTWGEGGFALALFALLPLAVRGVLVLTGRWWGH